MEKSILLHIHAGEICYRYYFTAAEPLELDYQMH